MKLIIDANVASEFVIGSAEAKALIQWLRSKGIVSTGGKNLAELSKTRAASLITELIRSGRGIVCSRSAVENAETALDKSEVKSNDAHVLALAIVGGARILFSDDAALVADFTNAKIIRDPRGKCYRHATQHSHLLR